METNRSYNDLPNEVSREVRNWSERMVKPSVFIGSSAEALDLARAIEFQLQNDGEITIWNEGFFSLSGTTLETLVNALSRFDFAILVLSPDDFIESRDLPTRAPRDNVMFELGLFMGRLGRARTFVVFDESARPKMPTDLAGVTAATFMGERTDKNYIAAVSPACTLIRNSIRDLGVSDTRGTQRIQAAADQVDVMSASVARLVHLLARSRTVELDIVARQFGLFLPPGMLDKLRRDLEDLEKSVSLVDADG